MKTNFFHWFVGLSSANKQRRGRLEDNDTKKTMTQKTKKNITQGEEKEKEKEKKKKTTKKIARKRGQLKTGNKQLFLLQLNILK